MATVLDKTADTAPTPDDILYSITDPTGTPGDRKTQIGALTGIIGAGFLNAATSAGATSATLKGVPAWLSANAAWLLLDPGTVEAEIRKVTAASGNALTVAALTYAHAANDTARFLNAPVFNVMEFGAKADGSTDDRAAIQAAVDAADNAGGGTVQLPPGIYDMTRGAGNYIVTVNGRDNIRIVGAGIDQTIVRWRPNIAWNGDTHTFWLRDANNIHISDLTIDGSFGVGTTSFDSEQKHGIRVEAISGDLSGVHVERVKFHRLRGDGVYLLGDASYWSQRIWLLNNQFIDGGRSGFVMNGVRNLFAIGNYADNLDDQFLDCEGTKVQDVFVAFNKLANANDVTAVQFSGQDQDNCQSGINFEYNIISGGGVFISNVIKSRFVGNVITGGATHKTIDGRGRLEDITFENNEFTEAGGEECISMAASTGTGANRLDLINNKIYLAAAAGGNPIGVYLSRGNKCTIKGNRFIKSGSGSWTGIQLVAFDVGTDTYDDMIIEDNAFYDLAAGIALSVRNGNKIDGLRIARNRFFDCTTAIHLNSALYDQIASGADFYLNENIYSGVTTKLNNESTITYWKTGEREWEGTGSPESVVTAPIGSIYRRLDGGTNTTLYIKTSGTGNTGWAAVSV